MHHGIAATSVALLASLSASPAQDTGRSEKVEPGLVAWHGSFDEACARAQETAKPVLLFQLIGRLDERFC